MNKRSKLNTTLIILLFTLAVIGGSNQAAHALYSNQSVSDQDLYEVETAPVQEELGLDDTKDTIEVWIVQEFDIAIYETAYIECHVLNLYGFNIYSDIEVWIQYSNGSSFLIYTETKTLHPYLEYVFTVTHTFTLLGYHLAVLTVIDEGVEHTTECDWYVYDGFVEISLFQEFEAQVGLEVKMTIYIQNGYAIAKEYYFELLLDDGTGPVQIFEDTKTIAAYDVYVVNVYWTFMVAGPYDVILRVLDIMKDTEYFDYCYWEVFDGFIDIIIEQNYETYVGVEEIIQIWVYNYYAIDITADIDVWVDNGTHSYQLYGNVLVTINAGTYFIDNIFYTFLYEGYWDLYVEVYVAEFDITWIEYCPEGWIVYGGFLDVWMYQRYEVFVMEEAIMYCWILSNYAVDRDITIEVWISNATHNILIYGESYAIASGELYDITVFWTFLYPDYWDVKLIVTDIFTETIFVDYCWWYVYGGYFELNIIQDYYALVDEYVLMRFEIFNYYAVDKLVEIEIFLFDGTEYILLYNFIDNVLSTFFFIFEMDYVFTTAGYYDVILIVTEEDTGIVWIETCWWWIYAEYLDLWIIQDFTAQVGEEVLMEFYIFNYYATPMDLTVNVWIDDGTDSVQIFMDSIIIPAIGVFNFTVLYTFLAAGPYTVELEVIDNATGAHWFKYCPWRIYEGYIDIWIIQDYEAIVGQEVWMQIYILSFYSFDVTIFIEVRIDTGYGIDIIFSDSMMILLSYQTWKLNISYTFTNPGVYQVYFVVVELQTGVLWTTECLWYVHDDGWLDIWIEQGYYGETGVNYTMQFGVGNLYSIDKTLNLVVKIVQGSDTWIAHNETKLVLSMTTYDFYVYWIFYNEGWYDVYFIVTDVTTGVVKIADCWWKIEEAVVVPEFNPIALVLILSALSAAVFLALRRRRKLLQ
ncbi:MAG: hypothetical protein ACTSQF_04370 [Candidatus Heimdallarchaeaceae archaeon]